MASRVLAALGGAMPSQLGSPACRAGLVGEPYALSLVLVALVAALRQCLWRPVVDAALWPLLSLIRPGCLKQFIKKRRKGEE